ncbi:MAG: class I SAM-dependent methyltransferase [Bacillota bacterium]
MAFSLEEIRMREKEYHDCCYDNLELFAEGSWLHKPVKAVMDYFSYLDTKPEVNVLDLGCGVGRNSIPIALKMDECRTGKIVCVDLLDSAIRNLAKNVDRYMVSDKIELVRSDIRDYIIIPHFFDFIFSVSTIEHLDSELTFDRVIRGMIDGTKHKGLHYILMNTNVRETHIESSKSLEPMFELSFQAEYLLGKFHSHYGDWTVLEQTVKPYELEIDRNGERVLLQSDVVTWAVQKDR